MVSTGGELGLAPAFVHSKNCGAPNCFHPWQHRCWIFPRDPHFEAKAGRILDQSHRPMKIEHEYKRLGAWAYLAALDVHRVPNSSAAAKPKVERFPLTASWIK